MKTGKALGLALGVTAVSVVLLSLFHGAPTGPQVWGGGATMFAVAFVVLKFAK